MEGVPDMAYKLPDPGQRPWGDDLINSMEYLRDRTNVNDARARANEQSIRATSLKANRAWEVAMGNASPTPFFIDPDDPDAVVLLTGPYVREDPDDPDVLFIG